MIVFDFILAWLGIFWDILTLPFTFADIMMATGFKYFLLVFGGYSVYLFGIAWSVALFQGKHGHPYYDPRDGF